MPLYDLTPKRVPYIYIYIFLRPKPIRRRRIILKNLNNYVSQRCDEWIKREEVFVGIQKVAISFRRRRDCARFGFQRWGAQSFRCCWGGFRRHYCFPFHQLFEEAFPFSCSFLGRWRVRITLFYFTIYFEIIIF